MNPKLIPPGQKLMSERETRARLRNSAIRLGCEHEFITIVKATDELLRNCTNPQEREHIAQMGALQINVLFGSKQGISVNGKDIK